MKDTCHGMLICCTDILYFKRHDNPTKGTPRYFESCFIFILGINEDWLYPKNSSIKDNKA